MGLMKRAKERELAVGKIVPTGEMIVTKLNKKEQKKFDKAKKEVYLTTGDIDFLLKEGELETTQNIVIKYAGIPRKYALLKEAV